MYDQKGNRLDDNDNWMDNPDQDEIENLGLAPSNNLESAIIDALRPGLYSSVVPGNRQGKGISVSELYDLSDGNLSLSAIGTRAFVGQNEKGANQRYNYLGRWAPAVAHQSARTFLHRRSVTRCAGRSDTELYSPTGVLISANDNWRDLQESEILATVSRPRRSRIGRGGNAHSRLLHRSGEGVEWDHGLGFCAILFPRCSDPRAQTGPDNQMNALVRHDADL